MNISSRLKKIQSEAKKKYDKNEEAVKKAEKQQRVQKPKDTTK
jgi:hypothetical protein